jgi:hypothetical protein
VPLTLPPPPLTWPAPYRRMAASLDIPTDLDTGYRLAAAFLDPVLTGQAADDQVWNPTLAAWTNP